MEQNPQKGGDSRHEKNMAYHISDPADLSGRGAAASAAAARLSRAVRYRPVSRPAARVPLPEAGRLCPVFPSDGIRLRQAAGAHPHPPAPLAAGGGLCADRHGAGLPAQQRAAHALPAGQRLGTRAAYVILRALRAGTLKMDIVPMFCGSSFKNKGVQTLLDYVCAFLPSPLDTPAIVGTNPTTGAEEDRKPSEDEKTSALAFKIATDPYVGRLTFFRVYSGKVEAGSYIYNTRSGKKERVSRLFQMHSNKQNPVEVIGAGDIGAGVGFKDIRTGDTLCDEDAPIVLESMEFPDPVIGIAVEPKTQKDLDKLSNGLAKLAEEDPTFTVKTDEQSGQTIISGMGELHLDIIIDRLKREFKVECNQGKPQVNYKEAITKTVELREVYKKQSGGRGKFADIIVAIGPVDEDFTQGGLQFIDEVKGGNVPKEFIPSVQKGFQTAMKNGVLAGYPLDSLKVVLKDGSFHPVDSDQLSFEICAIQAYKNACAKAGPVLTEPIMKLEVVTPEENMGDVIGDLNKRRGQVEGMESSRSGARIVKAKVPLAEMFGYVTALRTITSGRATSSMTYDHHAQVSSSIAKAVLEEVKGRVDLV